MAFYRLKKIKGEVYSQILDCIKDEPKTASQIGGELDISSHYARCYLKKLTRVYGCAILVSKPGTNEIAYKFNALELPEKFDLSRIDLKEIL